MAMYIIMIDELDGVNRHSRGIVVVSTPMHSIDHNRLQHCINLSIMPLVGGGLQCVSPCLALRGVAWRGVVHHWLS